MSAIARSSERIHDLFERPAIAAGDVCKLGKAAIGRQGMLQLLRSPFGMKRAAR
jgi:hypothetical protein